MVLQRALPRNDSPTSVRSGRGGRGAGLACLSTAWLFKSGPRREMFGTKPHLPQGNPRSYGRCSAPTCLTKVTPNHVSAPDWGESAARLGLNEILNEVHPGASKAQPGRKESFDKQDAPGFALYAPMYWTCPSWRRSDTTFYFIFLPDAAAVWEAGIINARCSMWGSYAA